MRFHNGTIGKIFESAVMKPNQKLTTKYWMAHRTDSDDVYLHTARKCMTDVCILLDEEFGDDWQEKYPTLTVSLIELKEVHFE